MFIQQPLFALHVGTYTTTQAFNSARAAVPTAVHLRKLQQRTKHDGHVAFVRETLCT